VLSQGNRAKASKFRYVKPVANFIPYGRYNDRQGRRYMPGHGLLAGPMPCHWKIGTWRWDLPV